MPLWKPVAIADLQRIIQYIAQENPIAAVEMGDMLIQKAEKLDPNPMLGRVGLTKGTRELVVHPNYILIYRVIAKVPEVLRVKHAARQWP